MLALKAMVQFSSLTGSGGSSASGCGARRSRKFGGNSEGVTPLPIPNRAVKPLSADGTWCASAWESRSPPVNFYAEAVLKGKASVVEHRLPTYRWRLLKRADEACALEALRPTSPDQLGRWRTAGVAANVRTGVGARASRPASQPIPSSPTMPADAGSSPNSPNVAKSITKSKPSRARARTVSFNVTMGGKLRSVPDRRPLLQRILHPGVNDDKADRRAICNVCDPYARYEFSGTDPHPATSAVVRALDWPDCHASGTRFGVNLM